MDQQNSPSIAFDLSTFLGALTHDLANPLNAISMNAELARLLCDRNQVDRVREVADRVLADCSRSSRLLRELRAFADAVKQRPSESVAVRRVVDAAELLARAQVTVTFPELRVEPTTCELEGNRLAWELAFAALLRNAAEAGARTLKIDIAATREMLNITVADDGSGMTAIARNKIGTPFFSTRREQGNTGLGIALCSYVVRAHEGELRFLDNAGTGTVVSISLPRTSAAE